MLQPVEDGEEHVLRQTLRPVPLGLPAAERAEAAVGTAGAGWHGWPPVGRWGEGRARAGGNGDARTGGDIPIPNGIEFISESNLFVFFFRLDVFNIASLHVAGSSRGRQVYGRP